MEIAPEKLDWVTERAGCTAARLFALLSNVVEADVAKARSLSDRPSYSCNTNTNAKIVVSKTFESGQGHNVVFERIENRVVVRRGQSDELFTATVVFSDVGRCYFEINGEPQELWQVSRKGLEQLFFPSR